MSAGLRLATCANGTADGQLMVVSSDQQRGLALSQWPNLLAALENWHAAESDLRAAAERVEQGEGETLSFTSLCAPLPRTWQWLDGSAFQTHADLMQIAFATDPLPQDKPLMYQGMSDKFYGPLDAIPFRNEADGIDFEGEFAVVVDQVPMGTSSIEALSHIKLVVQLNDWSLRSLAVPEMKTGFGWVHAKPACSMAPFALTPDALGAGWADARVCLDLEVEWNRAGFGRVNGREMAYSFAELIAHASATRDLAAGTVIGSGTVANAAYATVGSSCISERRAIEIIAGGKPKTGFMRFGDCCAMTARAADGSAPFGRMENRVVKAG